MFSLKNDNLPYITSFVSEVQKANEKNDSNNPTQSPSTKRIKNYKSIETSPIIRDKKLSSLKFPLITPIQKNKISILFDANHKSLNKLPKENLLNISDKRNKKMDMIISQITNRNNQIKKRNKCIQIEFNSNSINRLFKIFLLFIMLKAPKVLGNYLSITLNSILIKKKQMRKNLYTI